MAKVNPAVITNQINKYLTSNEWKKKSGKVSSGGTYKLAEEAGRQFVEVLRREIADNTILSDGVKAALDCVAYHSPRKISNGEYEVEIYFSNDLSRPSLVPKNFEPIQSLGQLYNNGAIGGKAGSYRMNQVWGTWHGEPNVGSRTFIPPSHFLTNAINKFNNEYSERYGVIKIKIGDGYIG